MNTKNKTNFDPNLYLDQLIMQMGLTHEAPERLLALKEKMLKALQNKILEAASQALEPEIIDLAVEEFKDEKNMEIFMTNLLKISPAAQKAMIKAVEEFTQETLEAFEILAKKS